MGDIIDFVIVIFVKMSDPISLLVAASFAGLAATRANANSRWITIGVGTAVMIAAEAALASAVASQMGQRVFTFKWTATGVATFLQIYLICIVLQKWRARRAPNS
jgi:hypothetical protein